MNAGQSYSRQRQADRKLAPSPGFRRIHLILLIVMNCLWAASYSSFKALPSSLDAGEVATLRFAIASAVLLVCWPVLPGFAPRGRDLVKAMVMGVIVFVIGPRLQVAGVRMGRAADASVLVAVDPLIVSVAAAVFLREHIGPRRWIGFILGVVGTVLLAEVWRPGFHLPDLTANVLIILSFLCDAAYSVIGKPLLGRAGMAKVLATALIAGTIVNLLLDGLPTVRAAVALNWTAWLVLGYLSLICTVVGFWLWFAVIREAPVNVAALTVLIQPVAGVAVAVTWLGESFHWGQLWGCLVILAGLIVGLQRQVQSGHENTRI
ncbi:MAG TPA: DMT family transporter [Candidatus Baltobacteraceae bacterium]|nr:DMT family transporter [Candidatus Baltobacteraceae bacterium]